MKKFFVLFNISAILFLNTVQQSSKIILSKNTSSTISVRSIVNALDW